MTNIEDIHEGDLIEAVKGESVVRGRLHQGTKPYSKQYRYVGDFADVDYYIRRGFTVTVLEKAAPPLPTEPGIYIDKDGDIWNNRRGDIVLDRRDAPFTRLEPVPVTVQKVIEHIASSWEFGAPPYVASVLGEFGVTE